MKIAQLKATLYVVTLLIGIGLGNVVYAACSADNPAVPDFLGHRITDGFGTRGDYGVGNSTFHRGYDLSVAGTPNFGAFFGGVAERHTQYKKDANGNPTSQLAGYGNYATVTNGNLRAVYGHAGSLSFTNGQTIAAGQTIGNWSACTGSCTGPHVHLEYQVMSGGEWVKVDPGLAQGLIDSGLDPQSADFAAAAIAATTDRCGVGEDALVSGADAGGYYNEQNELCDPNIKAQITQQLQAVAAFRSDVMRQTVVPPASIEQVANTPCMSKELQKIANQFADAPNALLSSATGSLGGIANQLAGPASGIMNKMFGASFDSLNSVAEIVPGMLNFQSQASSVLGDLLGSLGGTDAFSSDLCGMMVDMVVKFVQCQFPIQMPSFGDIGITGSLNDLLPDGCAGEAARDALYGAAALAPNLTMGQPVKQSTTGNVIPGTSRQHVTP